MYLEELFIAFILKMNPTSYLILFVKTNINNREIFKKYNQNYKTTNKIYPNTIMLFIDIYLHSLWLQ